MPFGLGIWEIVILLGVLALLFGAEVNVEAERSRELRKGEPASVELKLTNVSQRPQIVDQQRETKQQGYDIVLAIDLSESMYSEDFERDGRPINRLQAISPVNSHVVWASGIGGWTHSRP